MPTVPYVKQTWTDGASALSAARMTVLENGVYEVSLAPAVRVRHSANQSIANNTPTALAFNTEIIDQAAGGADTMHDTVTNNSRLTCRYAGVYMIVGNAAFAGNATGFRGLSILLNGATSVGAIRSLTIGAGDDTYVNVSTLYPLAVNDYVELFAHHTAGASLNVISSGVLTPLFMMSRVG